MPIIEEDTNHCNDISTKNPITSLLDAKIESIPYNVSPSDKEYAKWKQKIEESFKTANETHYSPADHSKKNYVGHCEKSHHTIDFNSVENLSGKK